MANALENAKMKWKDASDYDQLPIDSSTLLGVESSGNIFVVNPDSGVQTISVVGGVIVTKTALGPSYKLVDSVAFMRIANDASNDSTGGLGTVAVAGGVADGAVAIAGDVADAVGAVKDTAGKVPDKINPFNW